MEKISQEKSNQIAYDLMVILAMSRKPDVGFLAIFNISKNKKIKEEFLEKYSYEEIKMFSEKVFRDAFEKNVKVFSNEFDDERQEFKEKKEIEK